MKINEAGLDIIKHYEGYSSSVYRCPAGRWTIGFGSTWDDKGKPITKDQPDISEEYGERLLLRELKHTDRALAHMVTAELNENMYSSLSSFVYNVGSGNFQRSTLRMKLNRGLHDSAADEFPKWRKAGGKILAGLVRRRASERELFLRV
tara:strand:+ start:152 stop:598 length:447 start_codon:yes stop_codon:yes gene_type:complete